MGIDYLLVESFRIVERGYLASRGVVRYKMDTAGSKRFQQLLN